MQFKKRWLLGYKEENGSSLVEASVLSSVLLLTLAGAVDLGRAFYVNIEVASAAHAGALYGVQNPSDTTGMVSAAKLDAADVPSIGVTASRGCECSDGTSAVASCTSVPACSVNVVDYVEVDTSVPYSTLISFPGLPQTISLTGTARMRAAH